MIMIPDDWAKTCERMLREADPQYGGPIYPLNASELAGNMSSGTTVWLGLTGAVMSVELRHEIPSWQGPGFCCVLKVDEHRNERHLRGSVLHEYAHFVNASTGFLLDVAFRNRPAGHPVYDSWDSEPAERFTPMRAETPWASHGPDFIRVCCHLLHRANRLGWSVNAEDCYPHDLYGLRPLAAYANVLGDELDNLVGLPMSEVRESDPPEEFVQAAAGDLQRAQQAIDRCLRRTDSTQSGGLS